MGQREKVITSIKSISDLIEEYPFCVPSYQRPYVWGNEQIYKLLNDIYAAFERNKSEAYFIGTVILYKRTRSGGDETAVYELLDGQQRFTTLWLIAVAFSKTGCNTDLNRFLRFHQNLRIRFSIRNQVEDYFHRLLDEYPASDIASDETVSKDEYLCCIVRAVTSITGWLNEINDESKLQDLGRYIYSQVKFVMNIVPKGTDLNKLFTTINNAGLQLEQSDILKSLLLKRLPSDKLHYSKIWECCEQMNISLEWNAGRLFPTYDFGTLTDQAPSPLASRETSSDLQNKEGMTLCQILHSDNMERTVTLTDMKSFCLQDFKLSDIVSVSGELGGAWIGTNIPSEVCQIYTESEKIKYIQFKVYSDNYHKGIQLRLSQVGNNIEGEIEWAKGSKKRSSKNDQLLHKDWNHLTEEESSKLEDVTPGREGYGLHAFTIHPYIPHLTTEFRETDQTALPSLACRSIISFPSLLILTYRLFRFRNKQEDIEKPLQENSLLEIFKGLVASEEPEKEKAEEVEKFFKLLWTVRWHFDKYIVKWVETEGISELSLIETNISDGNISYTEREKSCMSMLQSMLYFTTNPLLWLTPFICYIIDRRDQETQEKQLSLLESIDNTLSVRQFMNNGLSLQALSWKMLGSSSLKYDFSNDIKTYLESQLGVHFRHYWFQKLEYILWKEMKEAGEYKNDEKFKRYRFISRNSVEHVFPQHHEFNKTTISSDCLDDFGNLALLNVAQNSSYSNQDVGKKKIDFYSKPTYDSLKLKLIYDKEVEYYNENMVYEHRKTMIEKIMQYYTNKAKY
jgi:hypothetical protein